MGTPCLGLRLNDADDGVDDEDGKAGGFSVEWRDGGVAGVIEDGLWDGVAGRGAIPGLPLSWVLLVMGVFAVFVLLLLVVALIPSLDKPWEDGGWDCWDCESREER